VTFTWDFGDGETTTEVKNSNTGGVSAVTHTFVDDGAYTVTCNAYGHDSEDSKSESVSVTVDNVAPVASASGDTSGDEGGTLGFACTSTDVGVEDSATYAWDFGDGGSATGASASHVFAEDGTYSVTCTATDDGGDAGSDGITVVVANVAPEIGTLSGPSRADRETPSASRSPPPTPAAPTPCPPPGTSATGTPPPAPPPATPTRTRAATTWSCWSATTRGNAIPRTTP